MLKFMTSALAIAWAISTPANAEYVYQGFMKVTTKSKACTKGPAVGTIYKSHFHPGALSGAVQSWDGSAIDIYNNFDSRSLRLNSGVFTSTAVAVTNTVLSSTTLKALKPSKVSITAQSPATIDINTTSLTFSGKITNPNGLKGQETCVIGYVWAGRIRS